MMNTFEMSHVSPASSEIDDEQIDVDLDPTKIDTDCHRCQHHHHQQQQQHRHGHQLQQPSCIQLRLSYADRPRLNPPMETEDRDLHKRSGNRAIAQSPSKYVAVSRSTTELLLSLTTEGPITSEKRFIDSPPSVTDRSLSSGASSSSSSSSSSAISSPPSSPPHKKHQRLSTVPSLDNPSPLSLNKSDDAFQKHRRRSCPSNASAAAPRSAPASVTNFFIEEILKPSFGVSSKSAQSPIGFRNTWGKSCAPEDRLGYSPDFLLRSALPVRPGLPSHEKQEHFSISRVSAHETEGASDRKHVTKKRKQSKPPEDSDQISSDLRHKVDLKRNDRNLSSTLIENINTRNVGVPFRGQSPNSKSSTSYQAPPLHGQTSGFQAPPLLVQTESSAFKLVSCSASSGNDCSNSNSSSNASQASGSLPEDNRKSEESDQHLSDPSSASSSSSSHFQSQQLPAWVYCTRYSDRPSSGPRSRKVRSRTAADTTVDDKRPRTAFTNDQLQILKREFSANQYLNEDRRHALATKLNLNETQIKIWFQNKRAKLKKASGVRNRLALELMAQGLYNHSTVTANSDCG